MFLTRISVNQPVFATMIMVAMLVFGIFAFQRLPIEQLPNVDLPVVVVQVSDPGATPEGVENDVAKPIESVVNTISGIDTIQSISRPGQAQILMMFKLNVNSQIAAQDVRDKIATIQATFPTNVQTPQVLRFDPSAMPIVSLALESNTMSPRDLTTLANKTIVTRLTSLNGVGSATVVGGVPRQLDIRVDPDKLRAYDVGIAQIVTALKQENQNLPAGSITRGTKDETIQVEGRIEDSREFLNIIVARQGGQPVTLGDVATVKDGQADPTSLAMLNGKRAMAIDVVKTQGANTVEVAKEVRATVAELQAKTLPKGVHLQVVVDNSVAVQESFDSVLKMLVEGAALAVIIVFLFLNSWRSTVITGLTLPISIIGTMAVLYFVGFTLNMMTLLALSLAVGLLIDDAIVVRENIMRHLHMGKSHRQAALDGTNEIGFAVLATTLSIVAVFLPVAFMDGILGRFFLQFGVTVSVAVLISLFVAFTLDPMLSSVWYDPAAHEGAKRGPVGRAVAQFDRFFLWVSKGYRALLRWSLRRRLATLGIAILALGGSFFLFPLVGVEFAPASDTGQFEIDVETPVGSSLDYTASKVAQVNGVLKAVPEVKSTYATLNSGSASGDNHAAIIVNLVPYDQRTRSPQDLTEPVRTLLKQIPGAVFKVGAGGGFGGGVTSPVQIQIYGDNFTELGRLANQLETRIAKIAGVEDVENSLNAAQPTIGVRINRQAASDLGVSLQQVGAALRPMLGGENVTQWTTPDGDNYEVNVRLPEDVRNNPAMLGALPIVQSGATGSTKTIRLDQIADIAKTQGPGQIDRQDLSRVVTVSANLSGVELGSVTPKLQAAIDSLNMPSGYRASMGGDAKQLAQSAASAGAALLLAVIFIYLVLASQFGSFLQPVAIMASLPLALIGVLVGLLVGGSTLNIYSAIGFIMLMGLVVKNAILLVDNANQHRKTGMNLYDSLVAAGTTRFRPIIMTTLAMTFGMMPMALNVSGGGGQNAPMAQAVIGGLISSTALTLLVVPVVLTYIDTFGHFVGRFMPKAPDESAKSDPESEPDHRQAGQIAAE